MGHFKNSTKWRYGSSKTVFPWRDLMSPKNKRSTNNKLGYVPKTIWATPRWLAFQPISTTWKSITNTTPSRMEMMWPPTRIILIIHNYHSLSTSQYDWQVTPHLWSIRVPTMNKKDYGTKVSKRAFHTLTLQGMDFETNIFRFGLPLGHQYANETANLRR